MVPSWVGILHNFLIVVATVQAVHVQVFDAQDVVVYAAVAFRVEFVVTFVVVIVVAGAEVFAVFVVAFGVLAVEEIAVFVVVVVVMVAALVVAAVIVVAFVVKVAYVVSGDNTWMWVLSLVECMGMAWA